MSRHNQRFHPVGRGIWAPQAPLIQARTATGPAQHTYGGRAPTAPGSAGPRPQARFGGPEIGPEELARMGPVYAEHNPQGGYTADGGEVWRPQELEPGYGGQGSPMVSLPAGFRLGVWLDVGGRNLSAHPTAHADRLQALGFNDACIMVNGHNRSTFGYTSVSESTLRAFAPELSSRGISLTLTSWLRPNRTYIDGMLASLPDLARDLGARAIEFDVEEQWMSRTHLSGFRSHADAADYVFDALDVLRGMNIEVGITPQVDPMTHSSLERMVERAHFVVPQAYSTMNRSWTANDQSRREHAAHIRSHSVDAPYGPRGLQTRAAERLAQVRRVSGPLPLIMGLAAYNRGRWSDAREGGHSSADIMRMELERTLSLIPTHGVQGVRYWSWKWIAGQDAAGGGNANSYSANFIDTVR